MTALTPTRRTVLKDLGVFTAGAAIATLPADSDAGLVDAWRELHAASREYRELCGLEYRELSEGYRAYSPAADLAADRIDAASDAIEEQPAQDVLGVLVKLRALQRLTESCEIKPDEPLLVEAIAALQRVTGCALPMIPEREAPVIPPQRNDLVGDELREIMRDFTAEPPDDLMRLWREAKIVPRTTYAAS